LPAIAFAGDIRETFFANDQILRNARTDQSTNRPFFNEEFKSIRGRDLFDLDRLYARGGGQSVGQTALKVFDLTGDPFDADLDAVHPIGNRAGDSTFVGKSDNGRANPEALDLT
jgi:hypothetical protein